MHSGDAVVQGRGPTAPGTDFAPPVRQACGFYGRFDGKSAWRIEGTNRARASLSDPCPRAARICRSAAASAVRAFLSGEPF
jgi:hypothetical protein